jgi:hypothetical protein
MKTSKFTETQIVSILEEADARIKGHRCLPQAPQRFHDPVLGSAEAAKYDQVSKALAESLPALTFAAGSNPIQIFNTRNFDMMEMRNSWPDGRTAPTVDPDLRGWRHSDIKDMAYLYTHKVFEKFVNLGGLDQ